MPEHVFVHRMATRRRNKPPTSSERGPLLVIRAARGLFLVLYALLRRARLARASGQACGKGSGRTMMAAVAMGSF